MTRSTLLTLGFAAVLAACSHGPRQGQSDDYLRRSERPKVTIDEQRRTIQIEPAILTFAPNQKDVEIVWSLPPSGKFRFDPKLGIVIDGEVLDKVIVVPDGIQLRSARGGDKLVLLDKDQKEIVNCEVREDGYKFVCRNRHTRPGVFKYSIRVTDGGSTTIERDPPAVNW